MRSIAKSPIQVLLICITILLSLLLQHPSPDLDRPYYQSLAANLTNASEDSTTPLRGVSIVITGATSGLGLGLAKYLHGLGGTIVAVGRSSTKLETLQTDLEKKSGGDATRVIPIVADLSDLESVSKAGKMIRSKFKRIDFLVNNAGMVHSSEYQVTAQGYESVFGVNYLAHVLLTEQLLPSLEKSKVKQGARIINISSTAHYFTDGSDLTPTSEVSPPIAAQPSDSILHQMRSYSNSKLAQVYHARSLARELARKSSSVKVLSLCPTWVATSIARESTLGTLALKVLAFSPYEFGLAPILFAMFHPDGGKDGNDYVTNTSFTDTFVVKTFCSLFQKQSLLRDLGFYIGGGIVCLVQKLFASVGFLDSSLASYNEARQYSLDVWSKQAIAPYL